jgi:hypothetical protein
MNPWNDDAGDTPAPTDARDRALAVRSAAIIWRAFPYCQWRYGERGRAFGRSDAGYLITLATVDDATFRHQVAWLIDVLAPRGMPSLLMEYQLESLGRLWRRERPLERNPFLGGAAELRARRLLAMDAAVFDACERICRQAASRGQARSSDAGRLLAAAVVDCALGVGAHEDALARWFIDAEPGDGGWAGACARALEYARAGCRPLTETAP